MSTGNRGGFESLGWIGAEAGVFKKYGIDVSFPRLEVGGPEAVAGLIRRDWDFVQVGTVPIVEAVLNGADPVILLTPTSKQELTQVMAKRGVSKPEQLAGARIGVLTEAGQSGVVIRLMLKKLKITASLVSLGTYQNICAALISGEVDAAYLPIDFCLYGQRDHGWTAVWPGAIGTPPILATTRRGVASNRHLWRASCRPSSRRSIFSRRGASWQCRCSSASSRSATGKRSKSYTIFM